MTRRYELFTIISGLLNAEQVATWQETLALAVSKWGGTLHKTQNLGSRNLGYRIRRKDTGYERTGIAIVAELDLPGNAPRELERALHLDPMVLRSMTTHAKPPARAERALPPASSVPLPQTTPTTPRVANDPAAAKNREPEPEAPSLSATELDKRLDEILDAKEL